MAPPKNYEILKPSLSFMLLALLDNAIIFYVYLFILPQHTNNEFSWKVKKLEVPPTSQVNRHPLG